MSTEKYLKQVGLHTWQRKVYYLDSERIVHYDSNRLLIGPVEYYLNVYPNEKGSGYNVRMVISSPGDELYERFAEGISSVEEAQKRASVEFAQFLNDTLSNIGSLYDNEEVAEL